MNSDMKDHGPSTRRKAMTDTLLPCPFCGSSKVNIQGTFADPEILACCQYCSAATLLADWNTRAQAPTEKASVPDGYVLVPAKATAAMLNAPLVGGRYESRVDLRPHIYHAMLAAAPKPSVQDAWIPVSDTRKPLGRTPILVAISVTRFYEYEDGTPYEQSYVEVTEGEYVPTHGEVGDYFSSFSSPLGDIEHVTHWMPLPAAPIAGGGECQ